ncbi:MAG: hypothetical protein OXI40_08450 [Chloroflexota bacterium]|nr:hypothetical protein [Chloroflexota bacterium]
MGDEVVYQLLGDWSDTLELIPGTTVDPSATATIIPSETPTTTEIATAEPTNLPTNTPTDVPTDRPTDTPPNTLTDTPTNTATFTPSHTPTNTPTATPTPTDTPSPTETDTPVPLCKLARPENLIRLAETTVGWDAVTGAAGYRLQWRMPGGDWMSAILSAEFKAYRFAELQVGTVYQVRVQALGDRITCEEMGEWSDTIEIVLQPTATPTDTPTNTPTFTPTNTPTNTPTFTPTNTPTNTPTYTPTFTPTDTPTNTPTNTPTYTPTYTLTPTPIPPTATPIPPTATPVPPTATLVPPTATLVPPTATKKPKPKKTNTPKPSKTPKPTAIPTNTQPPATEIPPPTDPPRCLRFDSYRRTIRKTDECSISGVFGTCEFAKTCTGTCCRKNASFCPIEDETCGDWRIINFVAYARSNSEQSNVPTPDINSYVISDFPAGPTPDNAHEFVGG